MEMKLKQLCRKPISFGVNKFFQSERMVFISKLLDQNKVNSIIKSEISLKQNYFCLKIYHIM